MSEQSTTPVVNFLLEDDLTNRFPEYVSPDTRKGYEGYIVSADKLLDVATTLRNEMGYDYLSSVTGVDYLPEGMLEVVYHAFKSTGGSGLVFKVQVPRVNPVCFIPGTNLSGSGFARKRGLGYVRDSICRSSRSPPNIDVGRILWSSFTEGLERTIF